MHVQPYTAGPNDIDPTYHMRLTGISSRKRDGWLVPLITATSCRRATSSSVTMSLTKSRPSARST